MNEQNQYKEGNSFAGQILERLTNVEEISKMRFGRIESDISSIQTSIKVMNDHSGDSAVAYAKLEGKVDSVINDVKEMKDGQKWLVRLVMALIIVAIVNLVVLK